MALLTFRRAVRGKRALGLLALVLLPATLAWIFSSNAPAHVEHAKFLHPVLAYVHLSLVVPVVALTFATTFPWPEADEGTLTYWFTSPLPRWSVALGRFTAFAVLGSILLPLSVVGLGLPLHPAAQAQAGSVLWSAVVASWIAYPAYLAIFTVVTTMFRWGVVLGIGFLVVENTLAILPQGAIQRMTPVFYSRCHLWEAVPEFLESHAAEVMQLQDPVTASTADVALLSVAVLALGASLIVVHLVEYRGKHSNP